MTADIRQGAIEANGIRFGYLELGDGPLLLLLHGFPDDAWTWSNQIPALADAGFRVVAPFLRGYPPSDVPAAGGCNSKTNGADAVALVRALGDEPAFVIGHDWGGLATFVAATTPGIVRRAAVVAVSHPATLLGVLEMPALTHHLFHVWFFAALHGGLAENATRANDHALIDYLWEHWTTAGHDDAEHVDRLKREVFDGPGVIDALLPYYRALVRLPEEDPEFVAAMLAPTAVPMLTIWGGDDPGREGAAGEEAFFAGEYRTEVIERAGHFVHREQPGAFNDLVLPWLAEDQAAPTRSATASSAG